MRYDALSVRRLWEALCRRTRQEVALAIGDRSEQTFHHLPAERVAKTPTCQRFLGGRCFRRQESNLAPELGICWFIVEGNLEQVTLSLRPRGYLVFYSPLSYFL